MWKRLRDSLARVGRIDQELVRRSAAVRRTPADQGLKQLTRSANHSLLWFACAAVLATRKGAPRRAALRGVVAIAGASATVNLVGKSLFPRRRPAADLMPVRRRLTRRPTSSSFPSGHAASAAAFTTAVTMEHPAAGLALAPVAAAVAYSRVHTGVHWPSDVAVGALIGIGTGLATRRWWPLGQGEPARARQPALVPAITDGAGLTVLVNPGAGVDTEDPEEQIRRRWPRAAVVYPDPDTDLVDQLRGLVDRGAQAPRALGVAGGDGTAAAVSSVAAEYDLPMVLIPAGTLNHFARDVGVRGLDDVAEAVATGDGVLVDLGAVRVDGNPLRWFVNTASLGGYPDICLLYTSKVLARSRPLRMELNGAPHLVWVLFVGNGPYRPKGFAPTSRPKLDTGQLDVRYVRADVRFSRLRFVLAALLGALNHSPTYQHLETSKLDVRVLGSPVAIATDGEVGPEGRHFVFQSQPAALGIYRANPEADSAGSDAGSP